ncbi:uncharacterized protein A4U43_C04F7860 [Asparagus officinalis]|uniref:Tim44-like domain-containing protein n=1 Tax=Asparagus officinalis TaxID=4686 RepID=A0A5P1F408_ASPOF|nr:mitochondrial import inner membrane translocase subunit TIM44-2 [Asparagus officinalis]ONK71371.1 uncharacterized protein A4U43_C04F7860 [Asparagus officinalis]
MENRCSNFRQFSVFKEFSKNLKGEAKSNPEFQQSVKELNEKMGVVKEDLKVRTKKTAEKLYKSVDDVWTEAEAKSKKVSTNVKEKLAAAKEEVSTNVKEKLSAAKEEVKETFGLGKKASSESAYSSTNAKEGGTTTGTENSQTSETYKESSGQSETLFGKFKSTFSSASPAVSSAFQKLKETRVSDLAKKGYNIVKDELTSNPSRARRVQYDPTSRSSEVRSTRSDIVVVPTKRSRLGKKWEAFKKKMEGVPIYRRMKGVSEPVVTNVVNKGQEIAEDMRERWETSDHPVVHKIQDLNETVFGETATALSFKEIRRRDPYFSLPDFVAEVQEMVRPVLAAYVKGDLETLKKYCSSEVIERCKGERQAYASQGIFFDNKILHISEVDVRETKMMGSTPIIIVGFQTQQIYCVRDREGSITDGGKDTIHTVYYAWAMQQIDAQELGEDALYPIWKLREMQQIGMQALI